MPKLITVTDMIRSFSDIIGRVHYKGESFDIKKGHNVVATLSPKSKSSIAVSKLNNLFKEIPHLSSEDVEDFENVLKENRLFKNDGGVSKWE